MNFTVSAHCKRICYFFHVSTKPTKTIKTLNRGKRRVHWSKGCVLNHLYVFSLDACADTRERDLGHSLQ